MLLCTNNSILVNVKPPGLTIVTNQWLKPTSHSGEGLRVQPTVVTSEHESWRVERQTHNVWLLCCRTRQDCSLTVISAMLWTASPHSLRNFILEVSKKKEKWRQWVPQLLNRTPGDLEAFLTCSCSIPAAAALCVCAATARSSDTGEPLRPSPGQRNGLKGNHKKSSWGSVSHTNILLSK